MTEIAAAPAETPAPGTTEQPAPAPIVTRDEPGITSRHKALNALGQRKSDALESARVRVLDWLWNQQTLTGQPWLHRFGLTTFRYAFALVCEWFRGRLGLQATSLVYTTLLSVIPLLALSFSLLKALGVHDTMEDVLTSVLSPLGAAAPGIAAQIAGFVDNVKVGVLSVIGVCTLMYTGISMVQKIEEAFSAVWQLRQAKPITSRLGQYLTVIILGPLLLVAGVSLVSGGLERVVSSRVGSIEVFAWSVFALSRLVPYLVLTTVFFVLYRMIPQTNVETRPALQAAGATALMWQLNSLGFGYFVGVSTSYNAIYSSFAVPLFGLIWLYVSWMIVLLGSQLSYYFQYPESARHAGEDESVRDDHEFWALWLAASVTRRFVEGLAPLSYDQWRALLAVPTGEFQWAVNALADGGLLIETGEDRQLILLRDPHGVKLADIWAMAHGVIPDAAPGDPLAERVRAELGLLQTAAQPRLDRTLFQLANEGESVAAPAAPVSTFQRLVGVLAELPRPFGQAPAAAPAPTPAQDPVRQAPAVALPAAVAASPTLAEVVADTQAGGASPAPPAARPRRGWRRWLAR